MNFLEKDFLEQIYAEIDSNGDVIIEGIPFPPQQILQGDNEAFKSAFADWCETQKEERLERAEYILSLYDNKDRFQKLKAAYSSDSVTPFVGAGLSIPSGYPGWTTYLYELRRETTIPEAKLKAIINNGEYEEAAQLLFDAMPQGAFNEHLENRFDIDRTLSGCVRFLPYCFSTSVITTNFDGVLKRSYDDAKRHFSEDVLGADATELPRLLGQGKNVLVKLHGKANTGRSRILTKSEYDTHYSPENPLEKSIAAIAGKTLLFLGCSLSTDRTVKCLKKILTDNGVESSVRHYAFLPIGDEAERIRRKNELAEANIFPIWYPADEDHDECLMALLEKLIEEE